MAIDGLNLTMSSMRVTESLVWLTLVLSQFPFHLPTIPRLARRDQMLAEKSSALRLHSLEARHFSACARNYFAGSLVYCGSAFVGIRATSVDGGVGFAGRRAG